MRRPLMKISLGANPELVDASLQLGRGRPQFLEIAPAWFRAMYGPMSMQLTRGAEGLDRRAFTVEEVERMLEAGILDWDDKFELIEGELVPMNAQNTPHSLIKSRIGRWFGRTLDDSFDVGVDVTIRVHAKALFEPDVVLTRRLDARVKEFVNIADALLVIEVADATLKRDMGVKARAYAKAGLAELWVVDLNARVTHVHREPGDKGFSSIAPVAFEDALTPLSFAAPGLRVAELEG